MDKLIEVLKEKYEFFTEHQKEFKEMETKLNNQTYELINSFDSIELFDSDDIEEICLMLDEINEIRFKDAVHYFKYIKQFPNQPQIINAKKVINDIKEILKEKILKDNKDVYKKVSENEKRIKILKYYIEMFENYDTNTYISSYDLYSVSTFLNNGDISSEIIDLYNSILINNNSLVQIDEVGEISLSDYNRFIRHLKQINESTNINKLNDDKKVLRLFNNILEKNYSVTYDNKLVAEIIGSMQELATNKEDEDILKRIKFLIHLHNIKIDLTDEQIEFATKIKDFYFERVNSLIVNEESRKNAELISYLEDDYKFENVGLLVNIFNNLEVPLTQQLKIISSIVKNNSIKKYNDKCNLVDDVYELFISNNISVEYLDDKNKDLLNSNIKNVTEVFLHLNKLDSNFIKELAQRENNFEVLIDILLYSRKEIINKLSKICTQENIDLKALINYSPYVLISSNLKNIGCGDFDKFINNLEFCHTNNIEPKSIENLLLEDTNILVNRYNILTNLYKLDITGNEQILGMGYIFNLMDRLIENHRLGYKFLSTNLNDFLQDAEDIASYIYFEDEILYVNQNDEIVLNKFILNAVKAWILNKYGEKYILKSKGNYSIEKYDEFNKLFEREELPSGKGILIIPEKYDYIDESLFEDKFISKLEDSKRKIKKGELIYNLDGCIISRVKFLRVCAYLKDVLKTSEYEFDKDAIKYALRFEKPLFKLANERKMENFDTIKMDNKTKKKKKK